MQLEQFDPFFMLAPVQKWARHPSSISTEKVVVTKWKMLGCPLWRNQYGTRIGEENGSKRPIISGFDKERELRMLLYNRWLVRGRSSGMMEHFVTQFPDNIISHNLLLLLF